MKIYLEEETVIFFTIVKWLVLASVVGALTGLLSSAFILAIHWITEKSEAYPHSYYLLPLALILSSFLGKKIAHYDLGTNRLIAAINNQSGKINIRSIPIKIVSVFMILGTGGSAGKESPCAQMGAGLSSLLSDVLRMDDVDRKKLVICGFSAGFACVFGTPVAGALFGIEVLFIGVILYDVLLPAFVASITAYHVSTFFNIEYFRYPLNFVPVFDEAFFFYLVLGALFFGLCSSGLIRLIEFGKQYKEKLKWPDPLLALAGGLLLIALTLLTSREYLGLGLNKIESCLKGGQVEWYSFLMKALFTAVTLSITRSGSIITPILFIGATAGSLFGQLFHLDTATFAALGFVSLLAGTMNTPIAMSIMAIEMFGAEIAPYAAVACIISFLMSGHRSLYSAQVLTLSKSRSLQIETGKEMHEVKTKVALKEQNLLYLILKYARIVFRKFKK